VADEPRTSEAEEEAGVLSPTCWFADREILEEVVGHPIPPDVWEFIPWGHRLVVVREEAAEVRGHIIIPDIAKRPYTRGWVISAGHQVGFPSHHFVHGCPVRPADLVGRKVMFGAFAGTVLEPDVEFGARGTHEGKYVILNDADLFGELVPPVQGPDDHLEDRAQVRRKEQE
jgi:co-chaperonin GroES (HSP10)